LRLAVVTSQYPVPGDSNRGRPVVQTVEALQKLVTLETFVPNARYPRWLGPRSYRYVREDSDPPQSVHDPAHYVTYPTFPLIGRVMNGLLAGVALEASVRRFNPDLILAYWLYPDAFGAARVAQRLGVPLVSGARGSDIRARDRVTLALTRRALAKSAAVLTVSDDLRRLVTERFGVAPDRVTTIVNGCNAEVFRPGDKLAARHRLGVKECDSLVLFVGRLVAAKGLRELTAAFRDLRNGGGRVCLAVVGHGPIANELQRELTDAGLAEHVRFPGALPPAEVALWMQACDVLCLPSHTEGYPNVLIEALACGRPIVATPVGGILEIVDESNGILSPVGEVTALRDALHGALSRKWDEAALSRRFRRSWNEVAAETLSVCEAALRQGHINGSASRRDPSTNRTTN